MSLIRTIGVGLSAMVTVHALAQGLTDRLAVMQEADGRVRLLNLPAQVLVEQAASLTPPVQWESATVAADGTVAATVGARFFRWRFADPVITGDFSAPLQFIDAPSQARPGQPVQFQLGGLLAGVNTVTWRVEGVVGGNAEVGVISPAGRFLPPLLTTNRTVEIRAEQQLADGTRAEASALLLVWAMPELVGSRIVPAATGGVVIDEDLRARLTVPPGALAQDNGVSVVQVPASGLPSFEEENVDTLALLSFYPDGLQFLKPARLEFTLDRYVAPGTTLPLLVLITGAGGPTWRDEGVTALVQEDGYTAVAELPHFSLWSVRLPRSPGPVLPAAPTVTSVAPATLREGELRPLLLRGSGFANVARITVYDDNPGALTPTGNVEVRAFAFDAGAAGELGVLVKSRPDPSLAAGATRRYRLRLTVRANVFADVPITVQGLNEFRLFSGQTLTLSNTPAIQRAIFSSIEIATGAVLNSRARVLAWQATDSVRLYGQILSAGPNGPSAREENPGRMREPDRTDTGAGDGQRATTFIPLDGTMPDGRPALRVNLNEYLPGSYNRIFGQGGALGHNASDPEAPMAAISEGMYAYYASVLNHEIPRHDPFDFNLWHGIADQVTQFHPEGRKGQQGVPGGFRPNIPRYGFHVGFGRIIEAGGGGGGGGGSFRPNFIFDDGDIELGLSGGSGGGGGGAVSLAAGGSFTVGDGALVNSSGGNGGNGGSPSEIIPNITPAERAALGHGGGGGPGGGGTIHLLAGERLDNPTQAWPLQHGAGTWGTGGFLMTVRTHRQANPPSWLAPMEELPGSSQVELAGPDFTANERGLRTSLRTGRAVEARALNPYDQEFSVRVFNSQGVRTNFLRGVNPLTRRVRLLLAPGTNLVAVTTIDDHMVLNREIVVLNTPDSDGDGFSDEEEPALGLDPNSADSDHDGLADGPEWLAGGAGFPGDTDGDSVPDNVEENYGSDPNDPGSTPWNVGLGSVRGGFVAAPGPLQVIRPAFGARQGVAPGCTPAQPTGVWVIRPAIGSAHGVPAVAVSRPMDLRVIRPATGSNHGVLPAVVASPFDLRVIRPVVGTAQSPFGTTIATPQGLRVVRQ